MKQRLVEQVSGSKHTFSPKSASAALPLESAKRLQSPQTEHMGLTPSSKKLPRPPLLPRAEALPRGSVCKLMPVGKRPAARELFPESVPGQLPLPRGQLPCPILQTASRPTQVSMIPMRNAIPTAETHADIQVW